MNATRLPLAATFAIRLLAAGNGAAADDPFARYRQALSDQLSAIFHADQTRRLPVFKSKPLEPNEPPDEPGKSAIKAFGRPFQAARDPRITTALERLQRLRPRLESILDAEGLPRQLIAVVLVESGAQPLAASPRQARGLWQLIPATARRYGLTVSGENDQRLNLEAATRAAAQYLRDLYAHFGDWPLALAAYNAGQDAVDSALAKSGSRSFWQLTSAGSLPAETRSYVPAVLRAMRLLGPAQPASPAFAETQISNRVYASVSVAN